MKTSAADFMLYGCTGYVNPDSRARWGWSPPIDRPVSWFEAPLMSVDQVGAHQ